MAKSKKKTHQQIIQEAMLEVGKEFSYDGTGWDISDKEAVKQKKRAELAGAIVRQFWNEHKDEILRNADVLNQAEENKNG